MSPGLGLRCPTQEALEVLFVLVVVEERDEQARPVFLARVVDVVLSFLDDVVLRQNRLFIQFFIRWLEVKVRGDFERFHANFDRSDQVVHQQGLPVQTAHRLLRVRLRRLDLGFGQFL